MAAPWEKYSKPTTATSGAAPQAGAPWSKYQPQGMAGLPPEGVSLEEQALAATDLPVAPAPAAAQPQFIGQSIPQAITAPLELAGTAVTGATTGMLGYAAGAVAGLIESIRNGTYGTRVGGQQMAQRALQGLQQYTYAPRTQMAQEALQGIEEIAQEAKLAPVPVTAVPQALAQGAVQQAARAAVPASRVVQAAGTQLAEVAQQAPEAIMRAPETIANVFRPGQQRRRAELARIIQEDPANTEAVRFRLLDGSIRPDVEADNVLKQGWREGVVGVIKASTDKDREEMAKQLAIYQRGKKNDRYRALNRPGDIVGKSLQTRIDYIDAQRRAAGEAIGNIARTQLAGQQIEYAPLVDRFIANLNNLGVKIRSDENGRRFVDLKDSEIQGDTQGETLLNNVLERMSDVTGPPDAKALHDLKQYLDTQISYGGRPQMNPLTAKAERQVKSLRADINETIGNRFEDYRAQNKRYEETITALGDLQKGAGTSIDFDSPNANKALGTALRKITSNYATRVKLMDALDQVDQVAKKYGMQIDDDIINQAIFANEIDRMFGAVADTSLKGQVAQAAETGLDFARKSNTERAFSLIQAGIEKVRGVNEENAIKSMEELLRRRTAQPGTAVVPFE